VSLKAQTLLMVTLVLAAAVLATSGVLGWSSRQALLAETEAQGLRLLHDCRHSSAGVRYQDRLKSDKGVNPAETVQMIIDDDTLKKLLQGKLLGIRQNILF
jgi:hypothetical protein